MKFLQQSISKPVSYFQLNEKDRAKATHVEDDNGDITPITNELKLYGKSAMPAANRSTETPLDIPAMNFDKPDKSKGNQSVETIQNNLEHTEPIPNVAPSTETPLEVTQMNFSGQADAASHVEEKEVDGLALPKLY